MRVMIIGEMSPLDLGIWGPTDPRPTPPIYWPGFPGQPPTGGGPQPPLGFWGGGNVPMPSPPIANVPGAPGYQPPLGFWGPPQMPPGFWGGGMGPGVRPQPPGEGGGQPPLGFWGGGNVPYPTPPIANVPGAPGYQPPGTGGPQPPLGIWGPYPGFPTQPIYLPPMPTEPPPAEGTKPPPPEGGWGYHPEYGWGYFPPGGGKPRPPGMPAEPGTPGPSPI
jgi:hypothetical protein